MGVFRPQVVEYEGPRTVQPLPGQVLPAGMREQMNAIRAGRPPQQPPPPPPRAAKATTMNLHAFLRAMSKAAGTTTDPTYPRIPYLSTRPHT